MWYLNSGAEGGFDMKVIEAWNRGYSGRGVVVTILDDGIEHWHPDLQQNYDASASFDLNGRDDDPLPRYDSRNENKHGTRCAGEVAAVANNSLCAVGVAFNARIGGIRMLDGLVSDAVEAAALSFKPQHVDIYSASWGPDDNGHVVEGPEKLAEKAFVNGVVNGRGGKGSIFVWASGNGGSAQDSCACDGYTNSIFTLTVSSVSEHNTKPWYLEECASTLATTYSSGHNHIDRKIVTTDLNGTCTEKHSGTSASAPLAAGIVALALEANPALSWRDMQHLVVLTSSTEPFVDAEWVVNGVGRKVSHRYGFGLLDAGRLVETAESWSSVSQQRMCETSDSPMEHIIDGEGIAFKMVVDACADTKNEVKYLEHVQARVSLDYSRRGDLRIFLTSPSGTTSQLLPPRPKDHEQGGFDDWPFMSVFYWGEDPRGTWVLNIDNVGSLRNLGAITKWQLVFFGTQDSPMTSALNVTALDDVTWANASALMSNGTNEPIKLPKKAEEGDASGDTAEPLITLEQTTPITCHEQCDVTHGCTGPHAFECRRCRHLRRMRDHECVAECEADSYVNPASRTCHKCSIPCAQCKGGDVSKDCLSCLPGWLMLEGEGVCVGSCPPGYFLFEDLSGRSCRPCAPPCLNCVYEESICVKCHHGYHLQNTQCIAHCSPSEFKASDNTCQPCHATCGACFGAERSECLSCVDGRLLQDGACVKNCDVGFFADFSTFRCRPCDASCADCIGPEPEHCLVCVHPLVRVDDLYCMETCPEGHFLDGSICRPCDLDCLSCRGSTSSDCLSCSFDRFLFQGSCMNACPLSTFERETIGPSGELFGACESCHPSCASCSGSLPYDCLRCNVGLVFAYGECLSDCPPHEFADDRGECSLCHDSCLTCTGRERTDCTSCKAPMLLLDLQCLISCPVGFYEDLHECKPCHSSCADCFGANEFECSACEEGLLLMDNECVQPVMTSRPCPSTHFLDPDSDLCEACHATCASCSDAHPTSCLSCPRDWVLDRDTRSCVACCSVESTSVCCLCIESEDVCRPGNLIDVAIMTSTPPTVTSSDAPSHSTSDAFTSRVTSFTSAPSSLTTSSPETSTLLTSSSQDGGSSISTTQTSSRTATAVVHSTFVTPETSAEETGVLTSSHSPALGDVTTSSFAFNKTQDSDDIDVTVAPTGPVTTPGDVITWWSREKLLLGAVVLATFVLLVILVLLLQSRACSCCKKKASYLPVPTSELNRATLPPALPAVVQKPVVCRKDVEAQLNGLEAVT